MARRRGAAGMRLGGRAALAAAVLALVYVAAAGRLFTETAAGEVWGRLVVRVEDVSLSSPIGVKGLELVYAKCGGLGCSGASSATVPARAGAVAELGEAFLYNVGAVLADGSYLPAGEMTFLGGYVVNASWGYSLVRGYAVLRLGVDDVRVLSRECGGLRLFVVEASAPGGCVLRPRGGFLGLPVVVEPVFGERGMVSATVAVPWPLRLLSAAAAVLLLGKLLHPRLQHA